MKRPLIFITVAAVLLAVMVLWWRSSTTNSRESGRSQASASPTPVPGQSTTPAPSADSTPSASVAQSSSSASSTNPASPPSPVNQTATTGAASGSRPSPGSQDPSLPSSSSDPQTLEFASNAIPEILKNADLSNPETRALVAAQIAEIQEARQESVFEKAARLGIPTRIDGPGNRVSILYDFRGDQPVYRHTQNQNAAISSAANLIYPSPYSLSGSGVRVAVWDGGSIRSTHQELTGRITLKNASAAVDDHATHVAGTIAASGVQAAAKGMASSATIDSYDWTSDYSEMTAAGAATASDSARIGMSNHSYGYDAVTADMGRYETEASSVDAVAASLPYYLPYWAAGNEQDTLTAKGGYQSITFNGLAKNLLTVGAADDAVSGGVRTVSAAAIASFSSLGPCDDGRIKPDVVANGVNLYSSISTGDTAYDTYSGTSMATPSALGSSALLAQLYSREFSGQKMRASLLKALLIHTADDVGNAGPDYTYGWGLINVKRAADLILSQKQSATAPILIENSVTNSVKTRTFTFSWDGTSPIRATLCWTDPAGTAQTGADSRTPNLVNNLDLKITAPDGTTVYNPYVMPFVGTWTQASMALPATTGKNNVDNVEQVYVATPSQSGNYTVTVSVDGTVTNSTQAYSVVLSGVTTVPTNPFPTVTLTSPADGSASLSGQPVTVTATASDTVIGGGAGVVSQVEFFAGSTSLGVDSTAPYSVTWTPGSSGSYILTARATDSEGAATTSSGVNVSVLSGTGAPSITSFTPTSAAVGGQVVITGQNFAQVSAVSFNGTTASYSVDSLTQITATIPSGASSGAISVVTARGTATSSSPLTVTVSPVLISQIYGGGGQAGATLNSDYVELYNRSASAVSLSGWTLQYASASGTTWASTALSGSIAAGKYYLIKLSSGTAGGALPTADATGTTNLASASGKIALKNDAVAFTGSTPVGQSGLQDFVGYGSANSYEGSAAAPSPSTTLAVLRAGAGATDTGDNAADFTTGAPNPRNSSGSIVAPAITSSLVAGGTVGSAFTYQITASNGPTSYNASGLPGGLSVNTSNGTISGIPTVAGTSNVTISATNSAGTGNATLALTITGSGGGGGSQLLSEDFASATSGNSTTTGGSSTAWVANTNFPTISSVFQAGGAVKLGSSNAAGSITSKPLNLSGSGGNFSVSFKVKGWTTIEGNITVTVTGLTPQTVSYTSNMTGSFESKTLNFTGGTSNATVKIETTAKRAFVDDVVVSTAAAATPVISAAGAPAALTAIYGNPSASPSTFAISGGNLTSGVILTAPAGFEISQTAGGATGYASTQTVGSSGTLSSTTIYVRLTSGISAGSYSGNISCTSTGAVPVNVTIPASDVRPKLLTITASDQSKVFGSALILGTSAFTTSGLVSPETVGSVTLTANGGTQAGDAPGTYSITPSSASGGTFVAGNYDISYVPGILTVTSRSFADWVSGTFSGGNASLTADPDADGVSNLMEYFLNLDPASPAGAALPSVEASPTDMGLIYRKYKGLTGVTGVVEWSTTMAPGSWSSVGVVDSLVSDNGTYETRRAVVPWSSSEAKKFLRLRVTSP